jgi:hypothetical protein
LIFPFHKFLTIKEVSFFFFFAGIGEFNSAPCHGDRTCDAHIETEY